MVGARTDGVFHRVERGARGRHAGRARRRHAGLGDLGRVGAGHVIVAVVLAGMVTSSVMPEASVVHAELMGPCTDEYVADALSMPAPLRINGRILMALKPGLAACMPASSSYIHWTMDPYISCVRVRLLDSQYSPMPVQPRVWIQYP